MVACSSLHPNEGELLHLECIIQLVAVLREDRGFLLAATAQGNWISALAVWVDDDCLRGCLGCCLLDAEGHEVEAWDGCVSHRSNSFEECSPDDVLADVLKEEVAHDHDCLGACLV